MTLMLPGPPSTFLLLLPHVLGSMPGVGLGGISG
ncbi:hypothetical protein FHR84_000664 [Actinopolyspora biskrensis]|uniref:Uncharacterized protein n=1 Tax=Actinopolyspora biskrensis TaxID=1470178 RepID=A0A852YTC6_9ACTN|nr:hypothetical protein [Actinopolyspora biskrensis]